MEVPSEKTPVVGAGKTNSVAPSESGLNKSVNKSMTNVEMSPEEIEKKEVSDFNDAAYDKQMEALQEENKKIGGFSKLMPYQTPKFFIATAVTGSLFNGTAQPLVGIIFSYLLTALSTPYEMLFNKDDPTENGIPYMKS
jgi:hypothetical protein